MPEVRNEDIVAARLKWLDYKLIKGKMDALSPIVYYFLMDASYDAYWSSVKEHSKALAKVPRRIVHKDGTIELKYEKRDTYKGEMAKTINNASAAYKKFFASFNVSFTPEQMDYIDKKMDSFKSFIEHDVYLARIAVTECINHLPLVEQDELSNCWVANLLAKDAQDMYGECYSTSKNNSMIDVNINGVIRNTSNYSLQKYGSIDKYINEKKFNRIQLAVSIIAKKVVEWIHNDYLNEIEKCKSMTN